MIAVRARPGATTLDDAELAQRAGNGDADAFADLFERWFDRAFDVAWHIVRNRDTAAEVTQEAFAVAWHQIPNLRQPASFGGWLLRIARNKGLSRLARDQRTRPVGDEAIETLDAARRSPTSSLDPVIDQERDDLVWAASVVLGPDDASLLNLHLRHELSVAELAGELGIQANAVHQRLFRLKRRLGDAIGAWILWHSGRPSCARLRGELGDMDAGATGFTRPTAATIVNHARACADCEQNRRTQLSPEALFCSVPIVAAGPMVRAEAAAALEGLGVPARKEGWSSGDPPTSTGPHGDTLAGGARRRRSTPRAMAMAATAAVALGIGLLAVAERAGDRPDAATEEEAAASGRDEADTTTADQTAPEVAPPVDDPADAEAPASSQPAEPTPDPDPGTEPSVVTTTTVSPSNTPPTITGFTATPGRGTCPTPSETTIVLAWSSTGATEATLGPVGGSADPVDPSGRTSRCSPPGATWALTVTGPGGTATETATAP